MNMEYRILGLFAWLKHLMVPIVLLGYIVPASADGPQYCTGRIGKVIIYSDGQVTILPDWRGDWITICNLSTSRGAVSPQTCRGFLGAVQQSIAMGRKTTIFFDSAPSCSQIPNYNNAPSVGYVLLEDQ